VTNTHIPNSRSLTDVLTRARAAVTNRAALTSTAPAAPVALTRLQAQHRAENATRAAALTLKRPSEPPPPRLLPTLPLAAEVCDSRTLSPGAVRLWSALHAVALHVAALRGYQAIPSSIVFHLPAVIAAALSGYSERHTYRLAAELRNAGLIDSRGFVSQVGKLRRYSGTLWAITLKPTAPAPRLRYWDFQHAHRPDFAEDYYSEKGAWRDVQHAMAEPCTCEDGQSALWELAYRYTADPDTAKNPAREGSDMRPGRTLRAVALDLPALIGLHPRHRHREVSRLASELAHALGEPGRFRQHCAAIYAALNAENEMRPGLSGLALQLQRLAADLAELAPWKKPGAVLASRLSGGAA
jgi:hypothetical protein